MYKQFNDMALEFLSRMEETFPMEEKIKVYKRQFIFVQGMNGQNPVKLFMESMIPYGNQILSRDVNFFKKEEFVNKAESISGKMGLIKYWEGMSDTTKNAIWEYMQGLYILGMGSLGLTAELQKVIQETGFRG